MSRTFFLTEKKFNQFFNQFRPVIGAILFVFMLMTFNMSSVFIDVVERVTDLEFK